MTNRPEKTPANHGSSCRVLFLFLSALIPTAGTPHALAPASRAAQARLTATTRKEKVDVGGYKLQMLCQGQGTPTVIVEAGLGEPAVDSGTWTRVIDEIAKTTRICVYNRAGLGASDAAPTLPRTSQDIAKDLHAMLVRARVPGPYILVGHSIGGFTIRVYASRYPKDVIGMVLVDSSHPDQWSRWRAALPPAVMDEPKSVTDARKYLDTAATDPSKNPERMDISASAAQVRAAGRLGSKPLIVLTHSPRWRMVQDLPDEVLQKLERISQELQISLLSLSSNSTHTIATKAGHAIHQDEPQLVIDAVLTLVNAARR
jgi:pimeloyl-ACP methyl ester carboxylesterase